MNITYLAEKPLVSSRKTIQQLADSILTLFLLLPITSLQAGTIYGLNQALMNEQNGQVTQVNTGLNEHNFILTSRDDRFITFSSPDPVTNSGVPPSSDIYAFDRATGQTRRIVNHTSDGTNPNSVQSFVPLSAALSPDNQLLAYGVQLTIRQGLANPQSTRELNIARASDGLILSNPTFGRGPVSDSFQSEFVGLSWDPGGNSFVTTNYVSILSDAGTPIDLPAIVRFSDNGNGTWSRTVLSSPRYFNTVFPPSAQTHIYPVISPSGAGLAFFSIFWPDPIGMSQTVFTRLIVANSDGSNPFVLVNFAQGLYPSGLSWSKDGTQLVFGIAPQATFGPSILASADNQGSVIRTVNLTTGAVSQVNGIDSGYWPNSAAEAPSRERNRFLQDLLLLID